MAERLDTPNRWHRWGWLGLILLAWGLRLWRLDVQDIWWDEARNIDVASRPVQAILQAPELDIHPPGYFLLLHGWLQVAGITAFTTRFFSLWWGVLLVPLSIALARRLGGVGLGWGVALYITLAPFLIGEAQETRMYTLAFALLTLTAREFWQVWQGRSRTWLGLGTLMAAAVLVHYSTVFVLSAWYLFALTALGIALTRARRVTDAIRQRARDLFLAGVWSLLLFSPQALRAYQQIAPYGNPNLQVPSWLEYLRTLWQTFTVGLPAWPPWTIGGMLLTGALFLVATLRGLHQRASRPAVAFLLASVIIPITLYYVVLVERATFAPRYISFVVPFMALLVGFGLEQLHRWRLVSLSTTLALVVFLTAGIYADQFNPDYFREDTSGLATWLMEAAGPEDVILVDVPYPLGFYYPRFSKRPEHPPPPSPQVAPAYYLFVDAQTVADRLNRLAQGKQRVFWVQWYKSDTDPRGLVPYLLRKYGIHVQSRSFRGYRVDVFQVPSNASYALADTWQATYVQFSDGLTVINTAMGQAPTPALPEETQHTPRPVWVALRWQRNGEPRAPYKASVRLWDPDGHLIAQDDRRLLNDRHLAPPFWRENETTINVYLLEIPLGTPPGSYTVTVRVYDPDTTRPLSVQEAPNVMAGVDAVIGQVQIRRAAAFPELSPRALAEAPLALIEATLLRREVAPGTVLPISFLWQAQHAPLPDLQVQLRLVDTTGNVADTWLTPPVAWYASSRWTAGELVRDIIDWRIAAETSPGTYNVQLELKAPNGIAWGPVFLGQIEVKGRARRFTPPAVKAPLDPPPRLSTAGVLIGYTVEGAIRPGNRVEVTLVWRAGGPTRVSYTGFVQLLDPNNRVLAQEDHIPQHGAAPTTSWLPGEYVVDQYTLTLPESLPPGPYRLIAGLYDVRTMQRVPVIDAQGQPIGDHVLLQTFTTLE